MDQERRRFFRIDETVGISWHVLDGSEGFIQNPIDLYSLVSQQDHRIEKLLVELEDNNPKVVELFSLFNQKLERLLSQFVVENSLVTRMANRMKEVNISACGIAFKSDEKIQVSTALRLEMTLYPSQRRIVTDGRVVGCDRDGSEYFWRIDFYGMNKGDQEDLIQHIVRSQSQQLKTIRKY